MSNGLQTYTADGKLQISIGAAVLRIHSSYSVYIPTRTSWTLYAGFTYRYTFTVSVPDIIVPSEWVLIETSPTIGAIPYHSYTTISVGSVTVMLMSSNVTNYYHKFALVKK